MINQCFKDYITSFAKKHNVKAVFSLRVEIDGNVFYRLFTSRQNALNFAKNKNEFVMKYDIKDMLRTEQTEAPAHGFSGGAE